MAQVQLRKSIKARRLDPSGQPDGTHEYAIPNGAIVDDLHEEGPNYRFAWMGHNYTLPAGQLGRAYVEVE
jgi:hypothetical protein